MVLDMKIDTFIVIESGETYSFSSFKELVRSFLGEDYYELSNADKKNRLEIKAYSNLLGTNNKINNFVLDNEKTYIYSLLLNTNIILFERVGVNILIPKGISVKVSDNYIIVNNYAKKLLKKGGDNYET